MPLGFAQQEIATHWPTLVMAAGVIILGVLAAILVRDRMAAARTETQSLREASVDDARALYQESERVQERAASLIESASAWSKRFSEHTANVERLLAELDEKLAALERIERQVREAAHAQPSRRPEAKLSQTAEVKTEVAKAPREQDPLTLAVIQRAAAGRTPAQIAGELKEHIGKVELILALRRM